MTVFEIMMTTVMTHLQRRQLYWRFQESQWGRSGRVRKRKTWGVWRNQVSVTSIKLELKNFVKIYTLVYQGAVLDACQRYHFYTIVRWSHPFWHYRQHHHCHSHHHPLCSGEIVVIVSTMEEVLKMKLEEYCGTSGASTRIPSEGNCKVSCSIVSW